MKPLDKLLVVVGILLALFAAWGLGYYAGRADAAAMMVTERGY